MLTGRADLSALVEQPRIASALLAVALAAAASLLVWALVSFAA
jgi:hypothetical protein